MTKTETIIEDPDAADDAVRRVQPIVTPRRRLTDNFDGLIGKRVNGIGWGGQFMWMMFDDGTYIFLDACQWSMDYKSQISDYWKVQIGLLAKDKYDRRQDAIKARLRERKEQQERERLAELIEKYGVPESA